MKFDFYLSEMAVANAMGGGLTQLRIVGDELRDIPHFFHVNRFAADIPAKEEFLDRSVNLFSVWDSDLVRKIIGRTRAAKGSKRLSAIKIHAARSAKKINTLLGKQTEVTGFICPQGANSIFTLEALKKLRPVKYITWVMDDHLLIYQDNQWHYPPGMELVVAKHLRGAQHVFVISPAMQQFYQERFGVTSTVLFGSSEASATEFKYTVKTTGPITIGYFGAVAAWQRDALEAVAIAIYGTDVHLHIYSGIDKLPAGLENGNVHFKGSVKPEQVLTAMRNYDAVLLPISFQQKMRNMSQFNIATKMSEYLACGVPLLAVGPQYAAMVEYLQNNGAAITVASEDKGEIQNAVKFLFDAQRVGTILTNAKKLVQQQVGTKPMQSVWQAATKA